MTVPFWALATLLLVVAAGIVVWPRRLMSSSRMQTNIRLFRSREAELHRDLDAKRIDEEEFHGLRDELARTLLGDAQAVPAEEPTALSVARGPLWVVPIIGVLAIVGYRHFGALPDLEIAAALQAPNRPVAEARRGDDPAAATEATGETNANVPEHGGLPTPELVARLEERLESGEGNADGWFLLGTTAMKIHEYARASHAFNKVLELAPDAEAPLMLRAQADFLAADRTVSAAARQSIDAAMKAFPDHPLLMELLALDAFQRKDYRAVIDYLQRGLRNNPAPDQAEYFRQGIAQASKELGEPAPELAATAGGAAVEVELSLAPNVNLPADGVVFVTAKYASGPPMPLAVVRKAIGELPATIRLDASTAMNPQLSLATAAGAGQPVVVAARYSRSGSVERSPDDVESKSAAIDLKQVSRVALQLGGEAIVAASVKSAPGSASDGRVITVNVRIDPKLKIAEGASVFVFAREVGGSPMPVAVRRLALSDLSTPVVLDDAAAMAPNRSLSSVGAVEIIARISYSGSAMPSAGDLEGRTGPLAATPKAQTVAVTIDRTVGA